MAVIATDGLSVLIGDGGGAEVFSVLKGVVVTRLEIVQRAHASTAVNEAWISNVGNSQRQVVVECEAYVTNEASALKVRSLALTGLAGNIRLKTTQAENLQFTALVTRYHEIGAVGEIKRMICRFESSGPASLS